MPPRRGAARVAGLGSDVGAQAAPTIDPAAWVSEHPDQQVRGAADHEARASIIASTGRSSLEEALR